MIKKDVRVKDQMSLNDIINMTDFLANGYFTNGRYTPYFRNINNVVAFFKFCVDGIVFEKVNDQDGNEVIENIYSIVSKDKELMSLYRNFYKRKGQIHETLSGQLDEIDSYVEDIVEYGKSCYSSIVAVDHLSSQIIDYFENKRQQIN